MADLIDRQAAIDAIQKLNIPEDMCVFEIISHIEVEIATLPSAQPNHNAEPGKMEIVHCKDCKHWNLQVGNVKGDGLGSCDFHNVNLVTGEGFCYWAEKRGEADGGNNQV